jgi:hypothetical protein
MFIAQTMQLKGRVTDATSKNAVASATVENTSTKKSTLTDVDGNFSLNASTE